MSQKSIAGASFWPVGSVTCGNAGPLALVGIALTLAGCATQPQKQSVRAGVDPKYGVTASPRVVADGQEVPRGGGKYHVGNPYTIAGKTYYPSDRAYSATGTASWYGADFHGRRTANGEIFDKSSISAAHPTMPLPSYARVTNLRNNHSIIVRVNDRGPYHGGRVMDVSQRVAEALQFKNNGTAQVKVEYVSKAALGGSDDRKLLATLRNDGAPAALDAGAFAPPTLLASILPKPAPATPRLAPVALLSSAAVPEVPQSVEEAGEPVTQLPKSRPGPLANAPLPPSRPFDLGTIPGAGIPIAAAKPAMRLGQAIYYVSTPISLADHFERRGPFEGLQPQQLHPLRSITLAGQ